MIDDELMNKFDSIEDLPMSEEMLGAYLEGNLTEGEISDVELMIQYHPHVCELYEDVTQSVDLPYVSHDVTETIGCIGITSLNADPNIVDSDDLGLSNILSDFDLPTLDDMIHSGDSLNNNNIGIDLNFNPDTDFNLNL